MELLEAQRRDKTLVRDFERGLGKVAYHAACHLRAQKIGYPAVRVLSTLPDTEIEVVEQCSAVDGTWGMKAQYYEMGRRYAQKLVRGVDAAEARVTSSPIARSRRGASWPRTGARRSTRSKRSPRPTAFLLDVR